MPKYLLLGLLLFGMSDLQAQRHRDDVVISSSSDNYRLVVKEGKTVVENTIETEYLLNGTLSQRVQPSVLYGQFISLDNAKCSGASPEYRNYTPENVFYDDTKVCYFTKYLDKKHPKCTARFKRTFNDIRYFARVYLTDEYLVKNKTVSIIIPASLRNYRLVERNFNPSIKVTRELAGTDSVFTYTVTDAPAMRSETLMPPISTVYPHVIIVGAFGNTDELYAWSHKMADVNCTVNGLQDLVSEVTRGCTTDEQKVAATYEWVQTNIRYVAFEAGESGHRPDTPAEVIRKRYGDCKGMALLLSTLLRAQGFDARLTDIGTNEIPYTMGELPTLAAANHCICTLFLGGNTYFLDATCGHIPYTHIPGHIQGQQAMIEDGVTCKLVTVPTLSEDKSMDILSYRYRLTADNILQGEANYRLCGDLKEYFLSRYDAVSQGEKVDYLANNLNSDDHSNQVTNVAWVHRKPGDEWAEFRGDVVNKNAVQSIDGEWYVEMNPYNNFFVGKVDTTARIHDFCLPVVCNITRQVELTLPAGMAVSHLPSSFEVETPQGKLSCHFEQRAGQVVFSQRMQIRQRRIALADIPTWNAAVTKWIDACNEQVILKRK